MRHTRRYAEPDKRGVSPVSDLKPVCANPAVQTTAAGDPPLQERAEDHITSPSPVALPLLNHRFAAIEREWLLSYHTSPPGPVSRSGRTTRLVLIDPRYEVP